MLAAAAAGTPLSAPAGPAGIVSRSRLAEAIVGSTAERLLERVACDLLVVRGPLA